MGCSPICSALLAALVFAAPALAGAEHPGSEHIREHGYQGPQSCEECHPGTAKQFLTTVHWTHASAAPHVENLEPGAAYGMKNRIYTMCNGNEIVNDLKAVRLGAGDAAKVKYSGCNKCHPGNHLQAAGSTGPAAEAAIDCLLCHSSRYDFRKRKVSEDAQGRAVLGQDRSIEAALAVGRPGVKNCMVCHEAAGGGVYIKRGFGFSKKNDVHAAAGMLCVDCHQAKDHKIPTGNDPNTWASDDGLRISCAGCHQDKPHADADYNAHTARIACQTCHIPSTGGAFAKDFTLWTQGSDGFYEPTTLHKDINETVPVYAWYNHTVANRPEFIGPKGSREDAASRLYPFKVFQGKAFFDNMKGNLLSMDFAPPMANGDALAGVAAAARILGIGEYEPMPGWQTIYFGSNHLVTKDAALTCPQCHAPNGVLDLRGLGYSAVEVTRLTSAEIYFDKAAAKLKDEW